MKKQVVDPVRIREMISKDHTPKVGQGEKKLSVFKDALHGLFCEEEETRTEIAAVLKKWVGGVLAGEIGGGGMTVEDVVVGGDEDGTRV